MCRFFWVKPRNSKCQQGPTGSCGRLRKCGCDQSPRPAQEILISHCARLSGAMLSPMCFLPCYPSDQNCLYDLLAQLSIRRHRMIRLGKAGFADVQDCSADMREVVNAVSTSLQGGCRWRLLAKRLPAVSDGLDSFRSWRLLATWERLHDCAGSEGNPCPQSEAECWKYRHPDGEDDRKARPAVRTLTCRLIPAPKSYFYMTLL